MNNIKRLLCILTAVLFAAFALPASATGFPKPFSLRVSVPPGQTTAPFTVVAKITNESIFPLQSLNVSVSGVTVFSVNNEVDTFALFPHVSLPLPPFAKLAFTQSSISITKDPMLWGETLTLTIAVNSCGDAQWSAAAWTGLLLNGESFTLDRAHSVLTSSIPCGDPVVAGSEFIVPNTNPQECMMGQRGFYDQDGGVRGSLQYFVTNNVFSTPDQLHFRWPDDASTGDPFAAFEYDVCAPNTDPPMINTIQVAWLNDQGGSASTGTPVFVPAQPCNDYANFLPAPYGTLVNSLPPANQGDTSVITVNALSVLGPFGTAGPFSPLQPNGTIKHPVIGDGDGTVPSFDIVIGNERMTVTQVASEDGAAGDLSDSADLAGENEVELETWTVTRGVGHTPTGGQNANALVMSTPKPLLPLPSEGVPPLPYPYVPGTPALMCVAAQHSNDPPAAIPNSHTTTFIDDGGDGWGSHP